MNILSRFIMCLLIFSAFSTFILATMPLASYAAEEPTDAAPPDAAAATDTAAPPAEETPVVLKAEGGKDQNAVIGKKILFNGSGSTVPKSTETTYTWNFGDGSTGSGIDPTHIYNRSGAFRVTLTVESGDQKSSDDLIVSVAQNLVVVISNASIKESEIKKLYDFGLTQNVLVVNIRDESKDSNFIVAQNLGQKLLLSQNDLKQAEVIIVLTSGNIGLNALAELAQAFDAQQDGTSIDLNWTQKTIVNVTDSRASSARIAQSTFNLLEPDSIILVKEDALFPVITAGTTKSVVPTLQKKDIEYEIISQFSKRALEKLTPFNFMSYGINYLINNGLDQNTILLILSLPVIATIIAIARQIIGIKAFGIYIPSIIALTFVVTSLKFGIIIFLALLITGTLARIIAKRLRLLYLPRMAILMTVVSLSIFSMFIII